MKQRSIALTLAGLLCIGLLSGCGSKDNNRQETPAATPAADENTSSPTGAAQGTYTAGMVLSVDGSQLTLQLYAPAEEDAQTAITGQADGLPSDYVLSEDTLMVGLDDASILRTPDETTGGTLSLADLKPGSILLVQQNADDGTLTDAVLQNADTLAADRLARISAVGDGGLEVTWYQSDDPESVITSYSSVNPALYTPAAAAETLTADDTTPVYRLMDGILTPCALSELTAGELAVISLNADGQALQIVSLEDAATSAL